MNGQLAGDFHDRVTETFTGDFRETCIVLVRGRVVRIYPHLNRTIRETLQHGIDLGVHECIGPPQYIADVAAYF